MFTVGNSYIFILYSILHKIANLISCSTRKFTRKTFKKLINSDIMDNIGSREKEHNKKYRIKE